MIKFENTNVVGWEAAIRGMRNPLNSWDKSDSEWEWVGVTVNGDAEALDYIIGKNDLNLMKSLRSAGTDHRKFLRMIVVYVDITAPLYWWKEFDTYKVGTVANSCSTMHKIHAKEFTLDDFSCERLIDEEMEVSKNGEILQYNLNSKNALTNVVNNLNTARRAFVKTKDKKYWWQMIQLLPSSYNQKRTVLLNYEVLNNIYKSRKNHKLDEWSIGFMNWIGSLPYAKELIIGEN